MTKYIVTFFLGFFVNNLYAQTAGLITEFERLMTVSQAQAMKFCDIHFVKF